MALLEWRGEDAAEIEDRYRRIDDEAALPDAGGLIVSLPRFESEKDALFARDAPLGVWLAAHDSPRSIANDLARLAVVALDFPAFNDGRAFSSARLLRERYAYKGELRAIGEVMLEQLPFMVRSGFNTFETNDPHALEAFEQVVEEVRVVYQPTGDGQPTALQRRLGHR